MAVRDTSDNKDKVAKQLAQNLRNDFHLLSTEARKKYPAIKESSERGAMRLKHLSEQHGFSLQVLAATEDVVRPLLFACESQNSRLIVISLTSLQRLLQYNAIPQSSVESILVTLSRLVDNNLEELKVLQTIVILVTSTETVRGKTLTQVLQICFKMYKSNDVNLHNTASVTIRQIVQTLFDRLNHLAEKGGLNSPEPPPPDSSPSISVDHRQLPIQVRDSYLIFQDLCFLINGDPAAWLPPSLNIELGLGLELLEIVLKGYPAIFAKERLFSVLLTERVCPLVIKLFSPSSKHRHIVSSSSSAAAAVLQADKPTFALHIRLLRILRVLIKEYFIILVTQCEIFLSMLVKFLDSDKPLWQRTLAVEVLHLFITDSFLLKSFCECYDMHQHSTKIFNDIIDGLAYFLQSNFHQIMSTLTVPLPTGSSTHISPSGSGSNLHNQHVFRSRSVTLHCDMLGTSAPQKPFLLEMFDKIDIPTIPEGYPLALATTVLLDSVKSLSLVVHNQASPTPSAKSFSSSLIGVHKIADVSETMLMSCWSGVLAALTLLLDAIADDVSYKRVLESFRIFIQLCGSMHLSAPRDAFLTTLCKSALPTKYAVKLATQPKHTDTAAAATGGRSQSVMDPPNITQTRIPTSAHELNRKISDSNAIRKRSSYINEGGTVGGASESNLISPTSSSSDSGKFTSKNIECIMSLLYLVHQHGEIMDTAWYLILTTLQYVSVLLGITKSKSFFSKPSDTTLAVSAEKRSELSEKFDDLFSNTKFLSKGSVVSLINALCILSEECLQMKDVCLFPVSCLLEVGLANTSRVDIIWQPITTQLTKLCNCSDAIVRLESADACNNLLKCGLVDSSNNEVQSLLLKPLLALSKINHIDVQQKQLECIEQLLHLNHQLTQESWIIVLEVINNVSKLPSESLVRSGFQSLQLIVTDFLPNLPSICLPLCLEVAGQYGLQSQDINISLTSIGHIWNIADHLYQNNQKIQTSLNSIELNTVPDIDITLLSLHSLRTTSLNIFDTVWMLLFQQLSDLCTNEQSAIRKSAAQTLFSTLSAHGSLLEPSTWKAVLWQVLFNVLKKVQQSATSASNSSLSASASSSIMIHHTRDTAQKQWAETQVIVLNGVSRVIQTRLESLCNLDGFERAWTTLLDTIKECSCTGNNEVSTAGLDSFKTILQYTKPQKGSGTVSSAPPILLWEKSWQTWKSIGSEKIVKNLPKIESVRSFASKTQTHEAIDQFFQSIPNQTFLLNYLEIFPLLVNHLSLTPQQFSAISQIFRSVLSMPISKDVSPFLVPSVTDSVMTSVQRQVIKCLSCLITTDHIFDTKPNTSHRSTSNNLMDKSEVTDLHKTLRFHDLSLFSEISNELLVYASYSWSPNEYQSVVSTSSVSLNKGGPLVGVYMCPFGLSCLVFAVLLLKNNVSHDGHVTDSLLTGFIKTLRVAFKLRYKLSSPSLWNVPINSLLSVLEVYFPILLSGGEFAQSLQTTWVELAAALRDFLFAKFSDDTPLTNEDFKKSEELDIKVIKTISSNIFKSSSNVSIPAGFLSDWTLILNEGSLATGTSGNQSVLLRESFAQVCFESLLQISFIQHHQPDLCSNSRLALDAILQRSETVLKKYMQEEKLIGNCPPSRSSKKEVTLVLKSVTTLIHSLKGQQTNSKVASSLWQRVCQLYPVLVDCVTCSSSEIRVELRTVLAEFGDIIAAADVWKTT